METTPRWRLILNGKSAGDEPLREAVLRMREQGPRLDVRVTWEAGDAERYVAEAIADGVDTVIAAGGDGTLSEVATTLAHRDEAASALPSLALVPMGTANDFASAALIPVDAGEALSLVAARPAQPIDLLHVEASDGEHWVANLASGGFGTEVTTQTHEGLKSMLGGLAYVVTGLSRLANIEPQRARVRGPGFEWEGEFIALALGNGRQAGGGQALCPRALIDDGLLDLTIVPPLENGLMASLGTAMLEGKEAALEQAALQVQLPWVELASDRPLTLNLDGEPVQGTRFRVECVPGRVRMHLPADCPLLANPAKVAP
ncbi:MAG: lipid kinase YegS [Pseudomonadota bacterium]